jgi:hypothetical protein
VPLRRPARPAAVKQASGSKKASVLALSTSGRLFAYPCCHARCPPAGAAAVITLLSFLIKELEIPAGRAGPGEIAAGRVPDGCLTCRSGKIEGFFLPVLPSYPAGRLKALKTPSRRSRMASSER